MAIIFTIVDNYPLNCVFKVDNSIFWNTQNAQDCTIFNNKFPGVRTP